ncbi:hypothetical protein GTHT12_02842 [Geobacillus thermodenitrificans]|nr:hypothetical protein GTHT12_02842 [Geobacillus thermodenitrificans]
MSVSNFFVVFFLGRTLMVNEFGKYTLGNSIILFILGLQTALIISPFTVLKENDNENFKIIHYSSNFIIQLLFILALWIVLLIVCLLPRRYNYGLNFDIVLPMLIAVTTILFQEFFRRLGYANLDLRNVLVNDVATHIFRLILILLASSLNLLDGNTIFYLLSISALIGTFVGYIQYRNFIILKELNILKTIKDNWHFGKWLLGNQSFSWINTQLFLFAGSIINDVSVAAKLSATQALLNPTNVFMLAIQNIMLPLGVSVYTKQSKQEFHRYILKVFLFSLIPMLGYCIFIVIFGEQILNFLYVGKYNDAKDLLFIWCGVYLLTSISRPFMIALQIIRKPQYGFYTYLMLSILSVIFVIPIVKRFGIYGIMFWSVFSGLIVLVISFYYYRKTMGLKFRVKGNSYENSSHWKI